MQQSAHGAGDQQNQDRAQEAHHARCGGHRQRHAGAHHDVHLRRAAAGLRRRDATQQNVGTVGDHGVRERNAGAEGARQHVDAQPPGDHVEHALGQPRTEDPKR